MVTETKTAGRNIHPQAISLALSAALLAFVLAVPVAATAQTEDAGSGNQQGSDAQDPQQQQEASKDDPQQEETGAEDGTGAGPEDAGIEEPGEKKSIQVRPGCVLIEKPDQILQVGPSCEDEEEGGDGPVGLAEDEESSPQTAGGTGGAPTGAPETTTGTPETTTGDAVAGDELKENVSAPTPEEAPEAPAKDLLDQVIADCEVKDSAAASKDGEPVPDEKATSADEKAAKAAKADEKAAPHDGGGGGGAILEGSAQDQKEEIEDEDGLSEEECQRFRDALYPEVSDDENAASEDAARGDAGEPSSTGGSTDTAQEEGQQGGEGPARPNNTENNIPDAEVETLENSPGGAATPDTGSGDEPGSQGSTVPTQGDSREGAGPETSDTTDCLQQPPEEGVRATVAEAIDGDTVRITEPLDGNDTVRLIGVDAPELEGEDSPPEPQAEEAASYAAEALEGEEVILEIGEQETDDYGRLLAYVWLGQGDEGDPQNGDLQKGSPERTHAGEAEGDAERAAATSEAGGTPELFNAALLEEGLAEVLTIAPNDVYAGCFEAAAQRGPQRGQDEGADIQETDPEQTTSEQAVPEESATEETAPEQETAPEKAAVSEIAPASEKETTGDQQETAPAATSKQPDPAEPSAPETTSSEEADHPEENSTEEQETADEQEKPAIVPVARQTADEAETPSHKAETPSHKAEAPSQKTAPTTGGTSDTVESNLPKQKTSTGDRPVLPATGGESPLYLLLGASCAALGGLLLAMRLGVLPGWNSRRRTGGLSDASGPQSPEAR